MNTRNVRSYGKARLLRAALICVFILTLIALPGCASAGTNADSKLRTHNLSEPLGDATSANIDIHTDTGNLSIDQLTSDEAVLANGTLEYLEDQGLPTSSMTTNSGEATFTLKASGAQQTGFRFPWEACNGETNWQISLNPSVPSDITAHSGGGNVKLNLVGMVITRLSADTGGGNMEVILPNNTANLDVTAKTGAGDVTVEIGSNITGSHTVNASSGAGNVIVRLPGSTAARIIATSGMGKALVDARFQKIDDKTYQTPDYESTANRVEITISSGAGNVTIETK